MNVTEAAKIVQDALRHYAPLKDLAAAAETIAAHAGKIGGMEQQRTALSTEIAGLRSRKETLAAELVEQRRKTDASIAEAVAAHKAAMAASVATHKEQLAAQQKARDAVAAELASFRATLKTERDAKEGEIHNLDRQITDGRAAVEALKKTLRSL